MSQYSIIENVVIQNWVWPMYYSTFTAFSGLLFRSAERFILAFQQTLCGIASILHSWNFLELHWYNLSSGIVWGFYYVQFVYQKQFAQKIQPTMLMSFVLTLYIICACWIVSRIPKKAFTPVIHHVCSSIRNMYSTPSLNHDCQMLNFRTVHRPIVPYVHFKVRTDISTRLTNPH